VWQTYLQPTSIQETLELLEKHAERSRLIAGGTDVLVELRRGRQPASTLIDITALRELRYVRRSGGYLLLGGLSTHNDVIASPACARQALPLVQACMQVGAPQIRTRATVAGNLITASPANDTIPPLLALNASLVLISTAGERIVPLREFYCGVRRTVLHPGELLREIRIPLPSANRRGLFLKSGLRRAQAIAVINMALVLTFVGEHVSDAQVTLGCLAPRVVHAKTAEVFLRGKRLDDAVCREAGQLTGRDVEPIDDVRGSAEYRRKTLMALVAHGLQQIRAGKEADGQVARPVLLETGRPARAPGRFTGTLQTIINGRPYEFAHTRGKTLLRVLREDADLTGTKEGCSAGECGACTVWLNGQAVMSCLVPAPQAHYATITTIEGLRDEAPEQGAALHPLQQAFIDCGAVQCGYCTPGMLMAGAKLLQEYPCPDLEQAQMALAGNICRCTGYRKILQALAGRGGKRS